MIGSAFVPGFYTKSNRLLLEAAAEDIRALQEKWDDEASEAALAGNPQKAGYIEFIAASVFGG